MTAVVGGCFDSGLPPKGCWLLGGAARRAKPRQRHVVIPLLSRPYFARQIVAVRTHIGPPLCSYGLFRLAARCSITRSKIRRGGSETAWWRGCVIVACSYGRRGR